MIVLSRSKPIRSFVTLFEYEIGVVAGVAAFLEEPLPFFGRVEGTAGELAIKQVRLLAVVAVGLDDDVLGSVAYALDLAQRGLELIVVEIMQRRDRDHEV